MRVFFLPFLGMTLLTFVRSLLTGWHYAVDGYVGMALAYACHRAAVWLEQDAQLVTTVAEELTASPVV